MRFYADCFWVFLRSAFDVLGQLVNEAEQLGLAEKDVEIKAIGRKLSQGHVGTPIHSTVSSIVGSHTLKRLEAYRHVSTHRRPVYISTTLTTVTTTATPGYEQFSTSGATQRLVAILCDDPDSLVPITTGTKNLVDVCEKLLKRAEVLIADVIRVLP